MHSNFSIENIVGFFLLISFSSIGMAASIDYLSQTRYTAAGTSVGGDPYATYWDNQHASDVATDFSDFDSDSGATSAQELQPALSTATVGEGLIYARQNSTLGTGQISVQTTVGFDSVAAAEHYADREAIQFTSEYFFWEVYMDSHFTVNFALAETTSFHIISHTLDVLECKDSVVNGADPRVSLRQTGDSGGNQVTGDEQLDFVTSYGQTTCYSSGPDPIYNVVFEDLDTYLTLEAGEYALTVETSLCAGADIRDSCVYPWDPSFASADFTMTALPNVIPIPTALWLFGSALGLLGWSRRRLGQ